MCSRLRGRIMFRWAVNNHVLDGSSYPKRD